MRYDASFKITMDYLDANAQPVDLTGYSAIRVAREAPELDAMSSANDRYC